MGPILKNDVTVLVKKCELHSPGIPGTPTNYTVFGENLVDARFLSVDQACNFGKTKIAQGVCVVVRPNYNETDADGTFYREWRSMDGGPFKEIRFGIPR